MAYYADDVTQQDAESGLVAPTSSVAHGSTGTSAPPTAPAAAPPWLNPAFMSSVAGNAAVATAPQALVYNPSDPTASYLYSSRDKYTRAIGGTATAAHSNPHYTGPIKGQTVIEFTTDSVQSVTDQILNMSDTELKDLQKKLGVKPTGFADPQTVDVVGAFLNHVSQINASGIQKTWQQVLNIETNKGKTSWLDTANGTSGSSSQGFSGTRTTTQSHVTKISPSQSRGLAEQTFQSELGHDPSKAERIDIHSALNERAMSNPAVTTTTTDYKNGRATDSHSVTDGTPDFAQLTLDEARSQPGYAEYQAVNYFDTLMSMLGAVGGA